MDCITKWCWPYLAFFNLKSQSARLLDLKLYFLCHLCTPFTPLLYYFFQMYTHHFNPLVYYFYATCVPLLLQLSKRLPIYQHLKKIWKHFLSQNIFHLSPVSLTPVINLFFRIYPRIFVKFEMVPMEYLGARGKWYTKKNRGPKISFRLPFSGTGGCVQLCIFHRKDRTNFVSLCLQKPLRRSLEPRRKSSKASPSCSWCAPFDKPQPSQTTSSGK